MFGKARVAAAGTGSETEQAAKQAAVAEDDDGGEKDDSASGDAKGTEGDGETAAGAGTKTPPPAGFGT